MDFNISLTSLKWSNILGGIEILFKYNYIFIKYSDFTSLTSEWVANPVTGRGKSGNWKNPSPSSHNSVKEGIEVITCSATVEYVSNGVDVVSSTLFSFESVKTCFNKSTVDKLVGLSIGPKI